MISIFKICKKYVKVEIEARWFQLIPLSDE